MAPILDEHTLEFVSRSSEQTQRLGSRLGALLEGGDVVCLQGQLGAGKTCLAQGIGRGWGTSLNLTSPTFVLMREYTRPEDHIRLHHIDLYRIEGAEDALTLGLDDVLGYERAVALIEWPERASLLLPADHLWIRLEFAGRNQRVLYFMARGERYASLLREFRRAAFGA